MSVSIDRFEQELIHRYQVACIVTMFIELSWLIWVVVATALYGSKAIFAWLMFFGVIVRVAMLIYSASTEQNPELIGSTIFSQPPEPMRAEQWFRWFGIKGIGRAHGYYSLFSQWVHPLVVLVLIFVQFSTRNNFTTDRFWVINCSSGLAYIIYSFSINWNLVMYGCVIPRENAVAIGRNDIL